MINLKLQSKAPRKKTLSQEKSFFALGTFNSITVFDNIDEHILEKAADRVFEIDRRMSVYRQDSEISVLTHKAGTGFQKVGNDIFYLLKRAVEIAKASDGAFDITMRPLVELWGIGKKLNFVPDAQEINRLLPLVDYRDVVFDEKDCAVALKMPGQAVDLGGIAKGYAADEVKRILMEGGTENALINLGGNIVAMGSRPSESSYDKAPYGKAPYGKAPRGKAPCDGQTWRIGIQNPLAQRGEHLGSLAVKNKTVVTSAVNERFFVRDGVRYHHIFDPRTGYPSQSSVLSVTAVCECSADADALTTAFFVMGPQKGVKLLEAFGAEAVFVTEGMKIYATGSLSGKIELYSVRQNKENHENQ